MPMSHAIIINGKQRTCKCLPCDALMLPRRLTHNKVHPMNGCDVLEWVEKLSIPLKF